MVGLAEDNSEDGIISITRNGFVESNTTLKVIFIYTSCVFKRRKQLKVNKN